MFGRLITTIFLVAAPAIGQDSVNPFKTPSKQPAPLVVEQPPTSTTLDSFQFNGVMKIGGKTRISLYDTKASRNIWVNEDEMGEFGIRFARYDEENETVVIAQGGISKKLALNKVKIEPLKITPGRPSSSAPATAANVGPRPNGRPSEGSVESDAEARARIQRVAEEIRRRRAERRQQLEQRNRNSGN